LTALGTRQRNLTLKSKQKTGGLAAAPENGAFPANVTTKIKTQATLWTRDKVLMCVRVSVVFDMLHVFSIHNEVLQNACSLNISLDSPATCINNSALAKRFQGKALPGACCQNEVSEHYSFLLFSLLLSASLTGALCCTLSSWSTGGIRPLDQPEGI